MKTFSSISALVISGALVACSASSGPSGEAVGNQGGHSGTTASGGSGGDMVVVGGTGGTAGTSIIPPGGMAGTAGDECGLQTFNLARKPAEVLLVLDRSASMKDPPDGATTTTPKWDLVIPALIDVVQSTDAMLSWGFRTFPDDGPDEGDPQCVAGSVPSGVQVEIAENNAATVVDAINATNDGGDGTPTGDAVKQAVAYLQSRASVNDYNRYILIATDGEPSCLNVGETTDGQKDTTGARTYAVSQVQNAVMAGFKTFVVGVGTNKESAKQSLNDMAIAGQEPAPCANPLDDCFYLGNSREQLVSDLRAIATNITTCVFELTATPPQPDNIRVTLDGTKIDRDMSKTNGWDYQDPERTIVEVYGEACDAVKGSSSATVEIIFGCPSIDVR